MKIQCPAVTYLHRDCDSVFSFYFFLRDFSDTVSQLCKSYPKEPCFDIFHLLQEMYAQIGPQFREELMRHQLPSSMVIMLGLTCFLISSICSSTHYIFCLCVHIEGSILF